MKCPNCENEMIEYGNHASHDNCIGIDVYTDGRWNECQKCHWCDIGWSRIGGDDYLYARQEIIEKWIIGKIHSFAEIDEKFICRSKALSMIRNYNGDKKHHISKKKQIDGLDRWCFYFRLFGKKYYLKRSVEKYLRYSNGLWNLSYGFDGE